MQVNPLGIDPIIFSVPGLGLQVRWYGLMYVLGFLWGGMILKKMANKGVLKLSHDEIEKYITHLIIGMFLGARTFYVFIYNWDHYSKNFSKILAVWEGGLSFHGAAVGMALVTYLTARKHKLHFFQISDSMTFAGTIGLFFGRMGNFINGELYGRITDSPFGMIFQNGGPYPRHPSQLYEGFSEGIILFFIMMFVLKKQRVYGYASATFVLAYGVFRYFIEFFREPDVQLGYYLGGTTTMGQILCMLMILGSFLLFWYAKKVNLPNPLKVDSK